MLSQRGSITTDVRTNTLIITDLQERLTRAGELIGTLDRPEPQVEIEARIVQTTRDFARRIGVQWGFNGPRAPELANTLPLAFPNQAAVDGTQRAARRDLTMPREESTSVSPVRHQRSGSHSAPSTARSTWMWRCRRWRTRVRAACCRRRA